MTSLFSFAGLQQNFRSKEGRYIHVYGFLLFCSFCCFFLYTSNIFSGFVLIQEVMFTSLKKIFFAFFFAQKRFSLAPPHSERTDTHCDVAGSRSLFHFRIFFQPLHHFKLTVTFFPFYFLQNNQILFFPFFFT